MCGGLRLLGSLPRTRALESQLRRQLGCAGSSTKSSFVPTYSTFASQCFISCRAAAASAASKRPRGRKKKTAAPTSPAPFLSSTSPTSGAAAQAQALTTFPSSTFSTTISRAKRKQRPNKAPTAAAAKEKALSADTEMMEKDVRFAMRMLMTAHLARGYHVRKLDDAELEKEKEEYLEKHEDRVRRLMLKDANSQRLLGGDGRSLGDGIVPILPHITSDPYQGSESNLRSLRGGGRSSKGLTGPGSAGVWRALNPVGLAASQAVAATAGGDSLNEDDYTAFLASSTTVATAAAAGGGLAGDVQADLDEWKSATLATLCAPNLAVYDTDHDFRVCSEDVVRQAAAVANKAGTSRRSELAATAVTTGRQILPPSSSLPFALSGETGGVLGADLTSAAAAQLKQQFAEEEDPDYAVSLYSSNDEDDTGPLHL